MMRVATAGIPDKISMEEVRAWSWSGRLDKPGRKTNVEIHVNTMCRHQAMLGVGGAFSEIGGRALCSLPEEKRRDVLSALFAEGVGAGFSFCRLPIGSSDFALDGYSHHETAGDVEMKHFSVARDEKYLIPFVRQAQVLNPSLAIHACPWSPPAWFKTSGNLISGSLINTPETHQAYARYFREFIRAYLAHGVQIKHVCVQNEPDVGRAQTIRQEDNPGAYPACLMEPRQMIDFTVRYLVPELKKSGLDTSVWGGTFRTAATIWAFRCMADRDFRQSVAGLAVQYSDAVYLNDIAKLYPGTAMIHTESVCHDGSNSFPQALGLFFDVMDYIQAGCGAYTYWNMILDENQKSSWGWKQNSLVVINRPSGACEFTPDYHIMNLYSRAVKPGSVRVETFCPSNRTVGFVNPDNTATVLLWNSGDECRAKLIIDDKSREVTLPGYSCCAVTVIPG